MRLKFQNTPLGLVSIYRQCIFWGLLLMVLSCKPRGSNTGLKTGEVEDLPLVVASAKELFLHVVGVQDQELGNHAFSYLTATGKKLFLKMQEHFNTVNNSRTLTQPSQCVNVVSRVLSAAGLLSGHYAHIDTLRQALGAKPIKLDFAANASARQQDLRRIWQQHFVRGIPTGTVVIGYTDDDSQGYAASAHSGIVGDRAQDGSLMIYHSNWLRPESVGSKESQDAVASVRWPFMVSLQSLYTKHHPREWMATPWLRVTKDLAFQRTLVSAALNDLDLLNETYAFYLLVPNKIWQEYGADQKVEHHAQGIDYVKADMDKEANAQVCRVKAAACQGVGCDLQKKEWYEISPSSGQYKVYISDSRNYGSDAGSRWRTFSYQGTPDCRSVRAWKCEYFKYQNRPCP